MKAAVAAALGVAILACGEVQEKHYATVAAARQDGAFARGWLPDILPEDAVDVWETHDIDTNLTWGCFRVPAGMEGVRQKLAGLRARPTTGPVDASQVTNWWPRSMMEGHVEAYQFMEEPRFSVVVGLDPGATIVCFHRRT